MTDTYEYQLPLDPMTMSIAEEAVHHYGALQDEWEFAALLEMVRQRGVRTMLEIGSYTGGSLWAWRQVVPNVFGVTLCPDGGFHSHGASMIYGDSTVQDTMSRMVARLDNQPVDFVFIDGGHDVATTRADMRWALILVERGLIGLHDINLHLRFPGPDFEGPRVVWDELRESYPTCEISNETMLDPGVGLFWIR